jgi:hypothetical protein
MENQTLNEYTQVITLCKDLFVKKAQDYGTSWRIMRLTSITDQVYIKAKRIREIEEKGEQKIGDSIISEYIGIINYCFIALIQMDILLKNQEVGFKLTAEEVAERYDERVEMNRNLLADKNHDYGEAWRYMRVSSMTDQILMKLYRIKEIEDNQGKTIVSEGVESIYQDIINYAIFCLIRLEFLNQNHENR